MAISTQVADLRAAFRRELVRLHATPRLGGPFHATREGELLAFDDSGERCYRVDSATVAALALLPDACGAESVWHTLQWREARP